MISLYAHQEEAVENLRSGSILCGGVGTGKSLTSIAYFFTKVCGGGMDINGDGEFSKPIHSMDLYIITTARKRDTLEWHAECAKFGIGCDRKKSFGNIQVTIDSWNNIKKYIDIKDAFFIFDEQRIVGNGMWVNSYLKIAKRNKWILLTATPGDVWLDYLPVFLANGFYKNRTEFKREHIVYSHYSKFPKIDKYIGTDKLKRYQDQLMVHMPYERFTTPHHETIIANYDKKLFDRVMKKRWNVYEDRPIKNVVELFIGMRRVVNADPHRLGIIKEILKKHDRIIIFYNFDYELEILRTLNKYYNVAEWNGHKHEDIPETKNWIYLVQYNAGAEGWNCITTNCVVFYSLNYSHKMVHQASGRIDRLNTPYKDLYYYHIMSKAPIDIAINKALNRKKTFHERSFIPK